MAESSRRIAHFRTLITSLLLLAQVGCTSLHEWHANGFKVGPNYGRPPAPVADNWIDADDVRVRSDRDDPIQWWHVFNDPVLDGLVQNAYLQNLPLREAGLRVLEARYQRGIAGGLLFPQGQEFTLAGQREQISRNVSNLALAPEKSFGVWDQGFNLAWELDIWGRFRRAMEAADAELDASVENYDDVMVTLLADVARAYVDYRTFERRIQLARENVAIQRATLEIAEVRFRNGATTELDVAQGRAILAQTEALIPQLEAAQRVANNQLCILMGMPPRDLPAEFGVAAIPEAPPEVAVGIPAELLRRRPDVRRAERQLAAQSARIGVATSDLYPRISLVGSIGLQANELSDLYSSGSLRGLIGPSLRWDILHYGRLANNIGIQDARFQQLAVTYQNRVLQANAEVENALIGFLRSQTQRDFLRQGVDATQRATDLVVVQYRGGQVDFTRVFQVQENLVTQQDREAVARGAVAQNLIEVYRSLGGGWELRLDAGMHGAHGMELEEIDAPPPAPPAELQPRVIAQPPAPI